MAQWLAQATHNRLVGGSNPPGPTDFALFLKKNSLFFFENSLF
jgi:hypothetical protein